MAMSRRARPAAPGGAAETATRRAVLARDAGLARISVVTRWLIAGVIALSGALALIAANAFHGHTVTASSSSSPTSSPGAAAQASSPVVAPTQPPASTSAPPVVVSGGS
jgi:hypothetical protein